MAINFGILSTFPPTQCGLATFSQALATHLQASGADVGIVRVVESPQAAVRLVTHQYLVAAPGAARAAAEALNGFDVAVVQHEYGIYGGRDGAEVLDVLAEVRVPILAVLHTVLTRPTPHQHSVLAGVVEAASVVVTMTETARQRLVSGWGVDPAKVTVIAHGAEDNRSAGVNPRAKRGGTVLTWGLLGEGKGIEWALEAIAGLADLSPRPLYRVVGQTHPRVLEREGEAYRDRLKALVRSFGITSMVEFDDRYLDGPTLRRIVRDADVILLPYDSRDQVTSGVLTEAVVAGKPVVSTAFPHAVELLSSGAGILVPRQDPTAIGAALRRVLTEPGVSGPMAARARALAPALLWSSVAAQYVRLGHVVLEPSEPAIV
jgi:glycosyltransferase involved in cell wall biosynthesis